MDTKPLERFAQSARRQLHEQVAARLERVLRTDSAELRGQAAAIAELKQQIAASSRQAVIERVAYTWFNLAAVVVLAWRGVLPVWLPLPFVLQAAETVYGALRPAAGLKPARVGVRQLIVSTLFTVLFIAAWRLSPNLP